MDYSNVLAESREFAVNIVKLYQVMKGQNGEGVLSNQLMHSGTAAGLAVKLAASARDGKEARKQLEKAAANLVETEYWLDVLGQSDYLSSDLFQTALVDCRSFITTVSKVLDELPKEIREATP